MELDEHRHGARLGGVDKIRPALELLDDMPDAVTAVVEDHLGGRRAEEGADHVGRHVVGAAKVPIHLDGGGLALEPGLREQRRVHGHLEGGVRKHRPAVVGGGQALFGKAEAEDGEDGEFHLPRSAAAWPLYAPPMPWRKSMFGNTLGNKFGRDSTLDSRYLWFP